jgi:hypothetical protein
MLNYDYANARGRGGNFALSSTVHEQAQSNGRACNIVQFCRVGLSLGIMFSLF